MSSDRSELTRSPGRLRLPSVHIPTLRVGLAIALTSQAVGVLFESLAGSLARSGSPAVAEAAFWIGIAVMVGPTAYQLATSDAARSERILLLVALGLTTYLVKVAIWPVQFTFHDEFVHWRTAAQIATTHHLFAPNPLTPVTTFYPGSEILTAALVQLSGLPFFTSGLIVVGAARLLLMLALYMIFEQVSDSPRVAGVAALLYTCNPNFLFFDAQFAYESLSVPLGAFLVFLALRQPPSDRRRRVAVAGAIALTAMSLAVTHHLTSWLFALGLAVSLLISLAMGRRRTTSLFGLETATIAAIVAVGLWFVYVGDSAIHYVAPVLTGGGSAVIHLIEGESAARHLFISAGQVSPAWEQAVAFASVAVILGGLPFALLLVLRRFRNDPRIMFLAAVAALYPASLLLRFVSSAVETSARLSEYLFFGVAFVLALLLTSLLDREPRSRVALRHAGAAATLLLVFGGGVIIAWGRWSRLPGPYLVSADDRSIENQGEFTARWAAAHLGTKNRIATDRTNALLLGSPMGGYQHPVSGSSDGISVNTLLLGTQVTSSDMATISRARVKYIVTDNRLSQGLPLTGVYVEPPSWAGTKPVSVLAARKFSTSDQFDRLYDSGDISIYSVAPRPTR